jgi:hypothetical protein
MDTKVPETVERLKNDKTPSRATRIPSMMEVLVEMVLNNENCLSVQDCIDHLMTLMATVELSRLFFNSINNNRCFAESRHSKLNCGVYLHDARRIPRHTSKFKRVCRYITK